MHLLSIVAVVLIIWLIPNIDDWLKAKLPPAWFQGMRWIMVLPMAALGAFASLFILDIGVFWPIGALPAFVVSGMFTAPKRQEVAGGILLAVAVLIGMSIFHEGWQREKTREWLAAAGGICLSCAGFIALKRVR